DLGEQRGRGAEFYASGVSFKPKKVASFPIAPPNSHDHQVQTLDWEYACESRLWTPPDRGDGKGRRGRA
ncbi:MAG: hypothetical protein AAGG44_13330, partial [Planctomycetota bacterium]